MNVHSNIMRYIFFCIFLLQSELSIAQTHELKENYATDSCISSYKNGKISFEGCYVKGKLVMEIEFDIVGNKKTQTLFINDSITVVTNYHSNGNIMSIYEKCLKTQAERGIYMTFFDNGRIQELGYYIPNSCNCSIAEINSWPEEHGFGLHLSWSRKTDMWIEFDENGNILRMIKYD